MNTCCTPGPAETRKGSQSEGTLHCLKDARSLRREAGAKGRSKENTRGADAVQATVRTGHGTTDWFQIGKGVCQGCILSPCLFNLYAEYIMRNAGLEETQAGIRIAGRNINNLRYADDTTLMAESEEELKSLLMKVKVRVKKLA